MRLCIVSEFFYPDATGGTGTVLSELVRALRKAHPDVEIDVVTSHHLYRGGHAPLPAYEEWEGVRIFRLATPKPNGLSTGRRLLANLRFGTAALAHLLRQPRYDLVLTGTAPPTSAMTAHLYRCLTGAPYVYIVYDLQPDCAVALRVLTPTHPIARLLRSCQGRWLRAASTVVLLGRCMKSHICKTYDLPEERTAVIPVGANGATVKMLPGETAFRARHGLSGFLVCYTGNFGLYQKFDTILDAAARLRLRAPEVRFVMVGDGAQRARIAARVANEELDNVQLFPFVPNEDYADLLASADVSLVTLEPGMEGLGVPSKFYNILASGRPVLAMVAPECEVSYVLAESGCGMRLDQEDADGLADAVLALSRNPAEARRMGENARAVLEARFDAGHVADAYYHILTRAAAPRTQTQRLPKRHPA